MLDFWRAVKRAAVAVFAYLADHEPVRTGLYVQGAVAGSSAWIIATVGRWGLPEEFLQIVKGAVGLLGIFVIGRVGEWQRSRVASAATAARLLNSTPPPVPVEPIPLAQEKAEQ